MKRTTLFALLILALLAVPMAASAAPSAGDSTASIKVNVVTYYGHQTAFQEGDAVWVCKASGGGCVNNFDMGVTSGNSVTFTGLAPNTLYHAGMCNNYIQNGNQCVGTVWAKHNNATAGPGTLVSVNLPITNGSGE